MQIKLHKITVRELTAGYQDNNVNGVRAYGGRLDVRPPYQREFVYKEKQRDAVIDTLTQGFPLNVMYWAVREDGSFEIMREYIHTFSQGKKNIFQYGRSLMRRSWRPTSGRAASAPNVASILNFRKWRPTISLHGMKEERPFQKTARCCVESAIGEKAEDNVRKKLIFLNIILYLQNINQ